MKKFKLLKIIIQELGKDGTAAQVLALLEDGQALAILGIKDSDQEVVEELHAMISKWCA